MKPMKAHRLKDHWKRVTFPVYTQPKLNGLRCLYAEGVFQSNAQEVWRPNVLAHLQLAIFSSMMPQGWILDGELYVHGWSLQQINSAAGVLRKDRAERTFEVEYHVFDVIPTATPHDKFSERLELLELMRAWFPFDSKIRIVRTRMAENRWQIDNVHKENVKAGYEGTMIRLDEGYGFQELCGNKENRWHRLLKYKDWLDEEYEVLGFEWGEGKHEGRVGSLKLEHNGQPFTAGSGLSDEQRDPNNLPKWVRVKYEMLSDGGVPLKPTIDFVSYE